MENKRKEESKQKNAKGEEKTIIMELPFTCMVTTKNQELGIIFLLQNSFMSQSISDERSWDEWKKIIACLNTIYIYYIWMSKDKNKIIPL